MSGKGGRVSVVQNRSSTDYGRRNRARPDFYRFYGSCRRARENRRVPALFCALALMNGGEPQKALSSEIQARGCVLGNAMDDEGEACNMLSCILPRTARAKCRQFDIAPKDDGITNVMLPIVIFGKQRAPAHPARQVGSYTEGEGDKKKSDITLLARSYAGS
ncbi:hypothetical protein BD626DRAFT_539157 [Schizophyllum amplum]|uniref:Uncharacterized protein n=1 Tax=Schizophyllum amplum TaxID=97359 RepID=A0A550C4G0_9AGAR|nr:hypothetical protein BD626DRAFT_539157 [Auriculariopsis ampla]